MHTIARSHAGRARLAPGLLSGGRGLEHLDHGRGVLLQLLELRRRRDGKYEGSAHPRTLTVATPRGDLAFPEASGTIGFGPETGVFESIRLVSPDANLAIEGDWTITPDGTVIGLLLDSQSEGLPPALVGIAPQTIGEIFDSLELRVTGETVVESLDLEMRALPKSLPSAAQSAAACCPRAARALPVRAPALRRRISLQSRPVVGRASLVLSTTAAAGTHQASRLRWQGRA